MSFEKAERQDINAELKALFDADQKDRVGDFAERDATALHERDTARMARAREIYPDRQSLSAESQWRLALLFQHGQEAADYEKAYELASLAVGNGFSRAKGLAACAEDRLLLKLGKKQKWGTQMTYDADSGLGKIDNLEADEVSGITDESRIANNVMTRAEMDAWVSEENQKNKRG